MIEFNTTAINFAVPVEVEILVITDLAIYALDFLEHDSQNIWFTLKMEGLQKDQILWICAFPSWGDQRNNPENFSVCIFLFVSFSESYGVNINNWVGYLVWSAHVFSILSLSNFILFLCGHMLMVEFVLALLKLVQGCLPRHLFMHYKPLLSAQPKLTSTVLHVHAVECPFIACIYLQASGNSGERVCYGGHWNHLAAAKQLPPISVDIVSSFVIQII